MGTEFNVRPCSRIESAPFGRSAKSGLTLLVASAMLLTTAAMAQNQPPASGSQYQMERANCFNGKSNEDGTTCLKEANAALAASKRGKLADNGAQYEKNAALRCQSLQSTDREACERRMHGEGTVSGSVAGGGILREIVVQTPVNNDPARTPTEGMK